MTTATTNPTAAIEQKARGELASFAYSRGKSRAHQSVKTLTEQTSHEYGNRFLIELVQNAYDAHPEGTNDGIIRVRLNREEGAHGILYIANGGEPFRRENFEAICDIGLSSRQPGESIGNKGLGFRSVLQVCRWPEVYSADRARGVRHRFDGYCFRFARPDDIRKLCAEVSPDDRDLAEQAIKGLSPYTMPVPLNDQNEVVRDLAREGFATVIRLPLNSDFARHAVEEQVEALRSSTAPIMLFLNRIRALTVEIQERGAVEVFELSRSCIPLPGDSSRLELRVELADLGERGTFLVATKPIERNQLMEAIIRSIDEDLLPSSWANWRGEAEVSVATRVDESSGESRLYNFLPMGKDATSSFAGFLNAPFYAKTDRTDINEEVPLNSFLLHFGAEVCTECILLLREHGDKMARVAIVDLVTWTNHHEMLSAAFERAEEPLSDARVIPIERTSNGEEYGSLKTVYRWPDKDYSFITVSRLVRLAGAVILDRSISDERAGRLDLFCNLIIDAGLDPSPETVAEWAEALAVALHKTRWKGSQWDAFYDDFVQFFRGRGEVLAGRKILLTDDNRLHQCEDPTEGGSRRRRRAVFFPPRRTRTEGEEDVDPTADIRIPASLHRGLCFLHPDLTWYVTEGRTPRRKASRSFLEEYRLVHRYDSRELLSHLARLLARTRSPAVWADALKWTYNLQKGAAGQRFELDQLNLRVPTQSGWQRAAQAIFSPAWPVELAEELARLLRETRALSPELSQLESSLVLAPGAWPFAIDDQSAWTSFLKSIGLRDGLWPQKIGKANLEHPGWHFQRNHISSLGIPAPNEGEWTDEIAEEATYPAHPNTLYRVKGTFSALPGQADYPVFPTAARLRYARLVIAGLNRWPENALTVEIAKPQHRRPDTLHWPTPLAAFLRRTAWMPMRRPGQRDELDFYTPSDSWHIDPGDDDPMPLYSPLVPVEFRRLIERNDAARQRLMALGLKVWGSPDQARDLLEHLGLLLTRVALPESQIAGFRKTYRRAWHDMLERASSTGAAGLVSPHVIVVSRNGRLESMAPKGEAATDDGNEIIYVRNTTDGLVSDLLQNIGRPVFDIGADKGEEAHGVLASVLGDRARLTSSIPHSVRADGRLLDDSIEVEPLLQPGLEWLDLLVTFALEFGSSFASQTSERARTLVLQRLRSVRLKPAASISVEIEGQLSPLPKHLRSLRIDMNRGPAIVVADPESAGAQLTWNGLAMIAGALAEAIGHSGIARHLELAIMKLSANWPLPAEAVPTDRDWANAFGKSEETIRRIRQSMRGSLVVALEFLKPIVGYYVGKEAAKSLSATEDELSEEGLLEFLEKVSASLPMGARELLELCSGASDLGSLRDTLRIDYAAFNRALGELGHRPIWNEEGHLQAFDYFTRENRERILGCIRENFLGRFTRGADMTAYVSARDSLDTLAPNPEWLDLCHLPSAPLMTARTDEWLRGVGAKPLSRYKGTLRPIDELRRENVSFFRRSIDPLAPILYAWTDRHSTSLHQLWAEGATEDILRLAEEDALHDFVPLTLNNVLKWLSRRGLWPEKMPVTADLSTLNLTDEDVNRRASEEARRRAEQEIERRSIELHGQRVDASAENWATIAGMVRASLPPEFLASKSRLARLEPLGSPEKKSHGKGGGSWGSGDGRLARRLTDEQRNAIGLVGEVAALEWLKRAYPDSAGDDCWKSTYRNRVLGGAPGNDSLGYDFEVMRRTHRLLFEVKASTGEAMEIELSESELECARQYASDRRHQYRILYVPNALDPKLRRIHVLPNPFSRRGRGVFRLRGGGQRYRFEIS